MAKDNDRGNFLDEVLGLTLTYGILEATGHGFNNYREGNWIENHQGSIEEFRSSVESILESEDYTVNVDYELGGVIIKPTFPPRLNGRISAQMTEGELFEYSEELWGLYRDIFEDEEINEYRLILENENSEKRIVHTS